jgi:hypothetical protein
MINYAGVDLLLPTPELEAWVDKYFSQKYVEQFQIFYNDHCGYFPQPFPGNGDVRLNTLVWPRDAGRWAYGCFLATTSMVEKINKAIDVEYVMGQVGSGGCASGSGSGSGSGSSGSSGSGSSGSSGSGGASGDCVCANSGSGSSGGAGRSLDGATLQIGTGTSVVNCKMYMLPPIPIARMPYDRSKTCASAYDGLWLITLVDDRFWWNMRATDSDTIAATTWNEMFSALMSKIGGGSATIETSSPYGNMPKELYNCNWQPQMAQIFDCYLYQTQKRLIKSYDGSYSIVGPAMAKNLVAVNSIGEFNVIAGGGLRMSPLVANTNPSLATAVANAPMIPWKECQDLRHALPRGITFLTKGCTAVSVENPFAAPSAAGRYKVYKLKYTVPSAFYNNFAIDWFEWRRSSFEMTIAGIYSWLPTGHEDYIEFYYGSDCAYTRIVKNQANDLTGRLLSCLCADECNQQEGLAEVVSDVLCADGKTTVKYRTIDSRYTD